MKDKSTTSAVSAKPAKPAKRKKLSYQLIGMIVVLQIFVVAIFCYILYQYGSRSYLLAKDDLIK